MKCGCVDMFAAKDSLRGIVHANVSRPKVNDKFHMTFNECTDITCNIKH